MNRSLRSIFASSLVLSTPAHSVTTVPCEGGLVRTRVASQPQIQNPVAVSVDVDGTLYVTETARRKVADLDIREVPWWIPQDLSHTSIEEKREFFRKEVTSELFKKHPSVKDANQDGRIDWKDLTVHSEKIHRLVDTDGDGIMDQSTVFAEGFNTEVTGIAAGVLAHRGDVFATIAPDLWRMRDTTGNGVADEKQSIAHGFGVHINYAGHDMHGLTLGPDGRLYWTIGDKGTNVVSKEGIRWFYPHEGALLRCFPDGSGFEVFAHGLRNVQEIAFDDFGNLFGVDNDADQKGEKERIVFIPEGSDTGWRVYYQYRSGEYNPWMAENIASDEGDYRPALWLRPICRYLDGPSGFSYNPGTALDERYRGSFFLSQFPAGKINAFKLQPEGAGFRMTDDHVIASGAAFIGSNFGPDGALYVADWEGGYPLNEKGAVWKIDAPQQAGSAIRKEVANFLKQEPGGIAPAELASRLAHADQRVRLEAQWELARRAEWNTLIDTASTSNNTLAIIHAIWGLTQGKQFDTALFDHLMKSDVAEVRAQAAKWTIIHGSMPAELLADSSPRVRYHAALAAARIGSSEFVPALIQILAENNDQDPWLRHAASFGLAACATPEQLNLITHPSPAVRRGAVVAIRTALDRNHRVTTNGNTAPRSERIVALETVLAKFLGDQDCAVMSDAAIAIHAEPGAQAALPALAALLDSNGPEPAIRRAIAASRHQATPADLRRLAQYAARTDAPEPLRLNALSVLSSAAKPLQLDPVDGHWVDLPAIKLGIPVRQALGVILGSVQGSAALTNAAGEAIDAVGEKMNATQLTQRALDPKLDTNLRVLALDALMRIDDQAWKRTSIDMIRKGDPELRLQVADTLASSEPSLVTSYIRNIGLTSSHLPEQQASITLLAKLDNSESKELLGKLLAESVSGKVEPELLLEVLQAAQATRLNTTELEKTLAATSPHLLAGGDAEAGRKTFEENLSANCTACHRIGPDGSNVGPALTTIGSKDRHFLLESLINPQAQIAEGFPSPSTMPPMGLILPEKEIRDLVEFLASQK